VVTFMDICSYKRSSWSCRLR